MKFSSKVLKCGLSPMRKFHPYAVAAEAKGRKIYHLNIGQPDIETPKAYFDAVKHFDLPVLAYAPSPGIPELIEAIRKYYADLGMHFDAGDILITNGGSEALQITMNCILDDGDEILIPEPFYPNYNTMAYTCGAKIHPIPTSPHDGYHYADRAKVEAEINEHTRAIMVTNPGNPTGAVLTPEEMRMMVDIAKEHDLFIIGDEAYREFVYAGEPLQSMGQFEDAAENVIVIDTVSKRFSACGARIGCMISRNKELMAQENAILSENTALWEKVFMAADKGMAMIEDGGNYGDFLLKTIENAKDQFTEEELTLLTGEATKIKDIENQRAELETKYPWLSETPDSDDNTSVPAGSDMTTPPDDGSMQKFPAFEGKDLDGNTVKSSELFSKNAVTVVNFWFTTCNPCVGELAELDALNKELAEKGGALIGVNTFTLDGNETAISEAKDVLAKKGATYQNVYFASDGEAGKFTTNIFAYPTTYVVDRNGNIVGDPIVGAITEKKQAETLQKLIDQALAADMG